MDCSCGHVDQAGQARFIALNALDLVAVFGLARQPGAIDAGPLSEIQRPRVVFGLFTAFKGGIKRLRANSVFSLESEEFFLQRMNVQQKLLSRHRTLSSQSMLRARK